MKVNLEFNTKESPCIINIDGGSRGNPGNAGIGIVINNNKIKKGYFFYIGNSTNNEAEYQALVKALTIVVEQNISNIFVYSDSELICKQINGEYKVKSETLLNYYTKAIGLIKRINNFTISYIPRGKNKEADKLANMAMDQKKDGEIELAVAQHHSVQNS